MLAIESSKESNSVLTLFMRKVISNHQDELIELRAKLHQLEKELMMLAKAGDKDSLRFYKKRARMTLGMKDE